MVVESEFDEWIPFGERGVWTHTEDVDLRISRERQLDRVQEPWTNPIQGACVRYGYLVFYRNSPVEYHVIVDVDDGRGSVPDPGPPTASGGYAIGEYEASLGRIVTGDPGTFQAYLNQTGIAVVE